MQEDEHVYQPLPEAEPINVDESQARHEQWLNAHYTTTPPKRLAARTPDEAAEDGTYIDGTLCARFPDVAFYTPPVKRPRGRPRKTPLPVASFAHTS